MPRLTLRYGGGSPGARFVDGGRPLLRREAIPGGGAADPAAAHLANRLLDQEATHPTLELPLRGGVWHLAGTGQIVLSGANMEWTLDGALVKRAVVIELNGNHELRGSFARNGCRGYLAVRGAWSIPRVRGSVEEGLPGVLSPVEQVSWEVISPSSCPLRSESPPSYADEATLNCVPGPEYELLDRERRNSLVNRSFTVLPASDRQGLRLQAEGPSNWDLPSQLSSAVLPGTVQLTPSGPIVLGPDAQTVGGYPRVLHAVDGLGALYQLRPGGTVWFTVNPLR